MQPRPTSIKQYLQQLPDDRKPAVEKLRAVILENLPHGFIETFSYGMLGFVVPPEIKTESFQIKHHRSVSFFSCQSLRDRR